MPITYGKIISDSVVSESIISNFEFIDRIKQINRFRNVGLHKSNIFSISIKDSGLNESIQNTYDEATKLQLQSGINNLIRGMIKNIVPAHTQLWKIEWKGE